ncbi:MAG: hypothetical protein F4Y74_09510 [Gemmatimonadales bacterium]|nr:hypothetical protein [Gemmatimonadales bacterium]MYG20760.1 hypothetical protein [Gemmatimonadales bacterium]
MTTQRNRQDERAATLAELQNAVETILRGMDLRLNRVQARWDERFTELRESVLAMRERAAEDRGHYDDMFNAVHRRFDRVEVRLDEIDRRRPRIGFGGEAGRPARSGLDLASIIRSHFGPTNGVDLELPPREHGCEPPSFES